MTILGAVRATSVRHRLIVAHSGVTAVAVVVFAVVVVVFAVVVVVFAVVVVVSTASSLANHGEIRKSESPGRVPQTTTQERAEEKQGRSNSSARCQSRRDEDRGGSESGDRVSGTKERTTDVRQE